MGNLGSFAVKTYNYSGISCALSRLYLRILFNKFTGTRPSYGIHCYEPAGKVIIGKIFFKEPVTHVSTLGKTGKDDGTAVVLVFEIIRECIGNIVVCACKVGLPL